MKRICLLLFILHAFAIAFPQLPSGFLLYGAKDGLSQNSVHAIFRDRDGLVWIGTQDGLNSFDGKNFTVYRYNEKDSNSISDQFILNIQEDRAGNLWIGTRNGLNAFNKRTKKFTRYYIYPAEKHIFQSAYFDFFVQQDNNVLVYTDGAYMVNAATGSNSKLSSPSAQHNNWLITPNNKAWIIDADNRFFYCPDLHKKNFLDLGLSPFGAKADYYNITAVPYRDSLLFVYNREKANEIIVFDTRSNTVTKKIPAPANFTQLKVITPDEIIGASPKGIFKTGISGKSYLLLTNKGTENGLPPGAILTTYKDGEGNLWVGTSGNGVAVTNSSFDNYQLIKPPVQNDVITCLAKNGTTLYAGTRSGLYKTEKIGDHYATGTLSPVLTGKSITGITIDRDGNIWAGVQGEGIVILNRSGKMIKHFLLPGIPGATTVLYMSTDVKGRIMIGTAAGFYLTESASSPITRFANSETKHRLEGDYVMNAFEDRDRNIWISNNLGLNVFTQYAEPKFSFQSSDDKSSFLKRTIITSVTQDSTGAVWIATIRAGIYKYYQNRFSQFTTSSGLGSDVVYNVICDNRNRIWATTSAGLNIFNEAKNSFTTLTSTDGVTTSAFVFGAMYKDNNYLLFGTSEGLLICDAAKVELHNGDIAASVSDVKINGQSIDIERDIFTIMPDGKLINFELAASPAFFSGNIIYQYRLLGQHDEWITLPPGIHTVSYTGLPYKKLIMQVRAAGAVNNLATATVSNLEIKSTAPFWKTTAFIVILVLVFVALAILTVIIYNNNHYKKQFRALQVEKGLQGERMRIGRDLHDNIGAYTSALIAGLNHIQPGNEDQEKHVTDLKEYGSNIMGFLRETIWMLNSETLTITAFADRFKNYALRISKNYPDTDFRFTEEIVTDKSLPPTRMLNIFRILQEALQNACKHSHASVISVAVKNTDLLYFEVKDNGKGFGEERSAENYGLSNMKQRAAESGFVLSIVTGSGGTVVSIRENTANAALVHNDETV